MVAVLLSCYAAVVRFVGVLNATHPLVKHLFDALNSFNMDERQLFLRFVWVRAQRLHRCSDNYSDLSSSIMCMVAHVI